jgi:flagellar motor protein MotB
MAAYGQPTDEEHEESYFVSMTDLMVGLLFIFITMLMYFALQYREAEKDQKEVTQKVVAAEETRAQLLEDVQTYLERKGIKVAIDKTTGILRLPNEILFERARAEISEQGHEALTHLAHAFARVLPCYTFGIERPAGCPETPHRIEAIFIEGHTDGDAMQPGARYRDNWELSVARAVETYRTLTEIQPDLADLRSLPMSEKESAIVLSVSGYGDKRPAVAETDDEAKQRNRRIDIRLIMATPRKKEVEALQRELDTKGR